jgi:hypothetical protein
MKNGFKGAIYRAHVNRTYITFLSHFLVHHTEHTIILAKKRLQSLILIIVN